MTRRATRPSVDVSVIDLNLLPKFRALYRFRSVSKAGKQLHLTQSALSNALAKMRITFGDELFVRTADGMEPTSLAHSLAQPIENALAKLESGFGHAIGFAPQESARVFRVAASQFAEAWILPRVLAAVELEANNVGVSLSRMTVKSGEDALADGSVDVVIGDAPEFGAGFESVELAKHDHVGVLRSEHPVLADGATSESLLSVTFIDVAEPAGHYRDVTRRLLRLAKHGAVRVFTTTALAVPYVVAGSDLAAIVPDWFARRNASLFGLAVVRLPLESTVSTVRMSWAKRADDDAGHAWLRDVIRRAATGLALERDVAATIAHEHGNVGEATS